jgi:hypothetical protein
MSHCHILLLTGDTFRRIIITLDFGVRVARVKASEDTKMMNRSEQTWPSDTVTDIDEVTVADVIGSGLFSSADEGHFSWRGCDNCANGLGATVYDITGRPHLGAEEYQFQVCADCLNSLYYGEPDDEMERRARGFVTLDAISAAGLLMFVACTIVPLILQCVK